MQRAAALAAAAVMTCCGFGNAAYSGIAATVQERSRTAAEVRQNRGEPVPVIISLNGEAVMDGAASAEYLKTSDAAAESDAVKQAQDAVIEKIRALYPELEVRCRYTTLVNGFSCSLPANLIGEVSMMPEVQGITRTGQMKVKKEMAVAPDIANIPYYRDETGCAGEGQVIAVIDSELDVTHPMFAPLADNLQKKISKSDLDAIASGIGFNRDFETNKAYISSKVPFAIDYSENPYAVSSTDLESYHGSHVCGIAAGNRTSNADGVAISGVAPDAQIVFMGMEMAGWDIDEILISAIEDAVKLNVDAINMSLGIDGDPMGQNVLAEAVNKAEAAGITVCIAAGNSDNGEWEYSEIHYADNPDVSWMNSFIDENTRALAVASAENPATVYYHSILHNGQQMAYEGFTDEYSLDVIYLTDYLPKDRDYEYVYCGLGRREDVADKDLMGKIALVDRGENYFSEKAMNARRMGAIAAIVVQNSNEDPIVMASDDELPLAMVSKADGEILKNAENKTIRFTSDLVRKDKQPAVSSYTSWGVHSSMDLRPDIMGVGGVVESAAYDGKTAQMSGTSMATPYMAGCSMILKQYLLENGCTLTGSELARYMRNLLMTGAAPFIENDMYVTPRRQGAGMVQMDASVHSKILLTGEDGESKLSLRDKLGTEFTFPLTLTNISNEDVDFSTASIALTTDYAEYLSDYDGYVITGQQPLDCVAHFGNATHIAAGETKTENITVQLDANQVAELKQIFTSGIFIEGYLFLENADNSADISIPLVGFSDNFAQIPAFSDNVQSLALSGTSSGITTGIPFSNSVEIMLSVLERIKARYNYEPEESSDFVLVEVYENATFEEFEELTKGGDALYCSPNHDGIADAVGMNSYLRRHCFVRGMEVLDADGNIVAEGYPNVIGLKNSQYGDTFGTKDELDQLPEGRYTARLISSFSENPAEEDVQYLDRPLYIDNTAPVIRRTVKEEDGKKIVQLKASDNCALDGIIVFGKGDGHIEGQSRQASSLNGMTSMVAACSLSQNTEYWFDRNPYYDTNPRIDSKNLHPFIQRLTGNENYDTNSYFSAFDYAEFIPAEENENGELIISYDVTDLSAYEFIAMDRAFNISYTNNNDPQPERKRGDVDCSGTVDVADAVLLARLLAEDQTAVVSAEGLANADSDLDGSRTPNDVVTILRAIARLISLDDE